MRPLRLFFSSKPEWEPAIRRSFRFTPHRLTFGAIPAVPVGSDALVVPLTLEDTLHVATECHNLGSTHPLAAPPPMIALCNDKHRANEALCSLGFGALVPRASPCLRPPYVLKKKVDQWGCHTRIVRTAEEEIGLGALLESSEYFRQQIVPGPYEYASHVVMRGGRVSCSVTVRMMFDSESFVYGRDGMRPRERVVVPCEHLRVLEAMLAAIGYEGLCCVDYKVRKNQPAIFEINPRFGASLAPYFYSFLRHLPCPGG